MTRPLMSKQTTGKRLERVLEIQAAIAELHWRVRELEDVIFCTDEEEKDTCGGGLPPGPAEEGLWPLQDEADSDGDGTSICAKRCRHTSIDAKSETH